MYEPVLSRPRSLTAVRIGQMFALRPTLKSLGVTQAQLDDQPEAVLDRYADSLVNFFCGTDAQSDSRWWQLAELLKRWLHRALRNPLEPGAHDLVSTVLAYPDSAERARVLGANAPQVYCGWHHQRLALVMRRANTAVVFTLEHDIQVFEALQVNSVAADRLEHDVFEGWALSALEAALQRVDHIDLDDFSTVERLDEQLSWASALGDFIGGHGERAQWRHERTQSWPQWLRDADAEGRLAYSQLLSSMAWTYERYRGRSFFDASVSDQPFCFAQQLGLQLRRWVLECSLQGREGITLQGYRIMSAAVRFYRTRRHIEGREIVFRPLAQDGFLVGSPESGPWLIVQLTSASVPVRQVTTAPAVGQALADPFDTLYRMLDQRGQGLTDWARVKACMPWTEQPWETLARLRGGVEQASGQVAEVRLLRKQALLLVQPGTLQPGESFAAPRLDSDWAGARRRRSVLQNRRLASLARRVVPQLGSLIQRGEHQGLYRLPGGGLVHNEDNNTFNITISPVFYFGVPEHQIVDNPDAPVEYGPRVRCGEFGCATQHTPRLKRESDELNVRGRKAVSAGRDLLRRVAAIRADARDQAQAGRVLPVESEEALERQAQVLAGAALTIARHTVSRKNQESEQTVSQLHQEATQLRQLGRQLRIEMTLASTRPTMGDVKYLLGQHAIRIDRLGGRVPETIGGMQDYLQEYEIKDLTDIHKPLWFAHFHYPALETADDRPSAAHLKTAAQRRLGREFEHAGPERVYRGPINTAAERQLFLTCPT